jgi:hypothetical protein
MAARKEGRHDILAAHIFADFWAGEVVALRLVGKHQLFLNGS